MQRSFFEFKPADGMTAYRSVDSIFETLRRYGLDISLPVRQGYDGVSVVAGIHGGGSKVDERKD